MGGYATTKVILFIDFSNIYQGITPWIGNSAKSPVIAALGTKTAASGWS
jgi:hypothetical protein